tara:strand:- start:503 stop:664 length:162 start_codon:yes stop_codon:yes gene_type:complete
MADELIGILGKQPLPRKLNDYLFSIFSKSKKIEIQGSLSGSKWPIFGKITLLV